VLICSKILCEEAWFVVFSSEKVCATPFISYMFEPTRYESVHTPHCLICFLSSPSAVIVSGESSGQIEEEPMGVMIWAGVRNLNLNFGGKIQCH
jgi:hypothetical protein